MTPFRNKILFVGYGAVAECTLPILFKHLKVAPRNVTVMDFEDRVDKLKPWTAKGVRFVRDRVTKRNLGALLGQYVGAGDLLIDLAWNIDCCEILQWCHDARRALRQHVGRAVGSLRRSRQAASD